MNILVIGTGEIGSSIIRLIEKTTDHTVYKKDMQELEIKEKIDVCHVCIPFSEKFVSIVSDYMKKYKPGVTIIESTVPPGTTDSVFEKTKMPVCHSPVRGKHPDLVGGLKKFVKFIGSPSAEAAKAASEHYQKMGLKTEILKKAKNTEMGKLLSTTYYATLIAWHQDMERMCKEAGADFEESVTRFSETSTIDINHKIPRPVMFPGFIGGHCLMPNIKILKSFLNSEFLDAIEHSNEKKKEDLIKEGRWQG